MHPSIMPDDVSDLKDRKLCWRIVSGDWLDSRVAPSPSRSVSISFERFSNSDAGRGHLAALRSRNNLSANLQRPFSAAKLKQRE